MKRVFVICDGMADNAVQALGGKTPLEAAKTPAMNQLASIGQCGLLQTVPDGFYPGSEAAILTILGYSPDELPAGRGPLEARGLDIPLPDKHLAIRYQIKDKTFNSSFLLESYPECMFHPISATKGICISPEDMMDSLSKTPGIRFWSADTRRCYEPFPFKHRRADGTPSKAAIIGAVPLLRGMALELNADWIKPDHATGTPHTDFQRKGEAAIRALDSHDYVIVHIEACDFASHAFDIRSKVESIENIDRYIIYPLMGHVMDVDSNVAVAVMSDHPSLCEEGCHSRDNSPFLYFYPGITADNVKTFSEKSVRNGSLRNINDIYGK